MNSDSRTFGKKHKNTKLHDRGVPWPLGHGTLTIGGMWIVIRGLWGTTTRTGNCTVGGFGLPVLAGLTYDDFLCT
ncbi:hypothetical protein M405DRAFT_802925 [Rhizopogon salebrosus TDB-379]|nr:hypothetical protein M405DRAFT_802925 [Rhizopogon salebrosus TDB-379]